jgi:formylglycine-generating enzyme required for sulfatase activity
MNRLFLLTLAAVALLSILCGAALAQDGLTDLPIVLNPPLSNEVLIPAGPFQMGCESANPAEYCYESNEQPSHTVFLNAYYIDNPPGPANGTYHVLRGGSWDSAHSIVRSARRDADSRPGAYNVGFRCARSE